LQPQLRNTFSNQKTEIEQGKASFDEYISHIGRKLKNVGKNVVLPVAKEAAKTALKDGAMALAETNPELMPLLPVANAVIDKSIGSGLKPKKTNKRAEIVKKAMKEHGISMIEASKYVKANNLY
jgi:hypothetical protein